MLRCVAASTRACPRVVVLCGLMFELSGKQRQGHQGPVGENLLRTADRRPGPGGLPLSPA